MTDCTEQSLIIKYLKQFRYQVVNIFIVKTHTMYLFIYPSINLTTNRITYERLNLTNIFYKYSETMPCILSMFHHKPLTSCFI